MKVTKLFIYLFVNNLLLLFNKYFSIFDSFINREYHSIECDPHRNSCFVIMKTKSPTHKIVP